MKKYFFMAVLASLLLLPSCKKESKTDPVPEVKNPLVEEFDFCKTIYGADTAVVYSQLVNDGWTMTRNDSVRIYSKLDGNNISIELGIRDIDGVVNVVNARLIDQNVDAVLINAEAFKGCMSYIGESCTIAGINYSFKAMMYYVGGKPNVETDFTEALNVVLESYDEEYINPIWSGSDSHAILLSKRTDEETGKDIVNIVIG